MTPRRTYRSLLLVVALAACGDAPQGDPHRDDTGPAAGAGRAPGGSQGPAAFPPGSNDAGSNDAGASDAGANDAGANDADGAPPDVPAALDAGAQDAGAETIEQPACQLLPEEIGVEVERTFRSSEGRELLFHFELPANHDPSVPTGILMDFHGNIEDPDNTFVPHLYGVRAEARARGLIPVEGRSPEIRADGRRSWSLRDTLVLHELLQSNLMGCFALDKDKVYLQGHSQGTCFIQDFIQLYYDSYRGGFLGYCGCWGAAYDDVDMARMRDSFKIFVQSTTEDFLYGGAVLGRDIFKYNLGMDVRADLLNSGEHCAPGAWSQSEVMDWMLDIQDLPDAAPVAHWRAVETERTDRTNRITLASDGRYFAVTDRFDVTPEELAQVQAKKRELFGDQTAFYTWVDAFMPQYRQLVAVVTVSDDYGDTWQEVGRASAHVSDINVTPGGDIYLSTTEGVLRAVEGGTFEPAGFAGSWIFGLSQDDLGRVYAYVQEQGIYRVAPGSDVWEPVRTWQGRHLWSSWRYDLAEWKDGVIALWGQGRSLPVSSDYGASWSERELPDEAYYFVHRGTRFFALSASRDKIFTSADAGASWQEIPVPPLVGDREALSLGVDGTLLLIARVGSWLTRDLGVTWEPALGFNEMDDADVAWQDATHAIVASRHGLFRYEVP